ncbi:hypothetical protein LT337_26470 [Mycolicibacterium fortuitum]|nr:hypothetical protein LT337_26470 [Mycolicibacterium fortuitum]
MTAAGVVPSTQRAVWLTKPCSSVPLTLAVAEPALVVVVVGVSDVALDGVGAVSVSRVAAPSPPLARTAASTAAIPSNPTDAMIRLSWARLNRGFRAGSCSACAGAAPVGTA